MSTTENNPLIKVFGCIVRQPFLTPKQFHDHYRHPHGTLARPMPTIVTYGQSHQFDTDLLDYNQHRFEAIMEVRLAKVEHWFGFRENPYLVENLIPDEPNFVDVPASRFVATYEEVLPAPPIARLTKPDALLTKANKMWSPDLAALPVKLVQLVPLSQEDSWASDDDAELGYRIGALRHVRAKAIPDIQAPNNEFCGVRELWWPTSSAFHEGILQDHKAWHQLVDQTKAAVTLLVQYEKFF